MKYFVVSLNHYFCSVRYLCLEYFDDPNDMIVKNIENLSNITFNLYSEFIFIFCPLLSI